MEAGTGRRPMRSFSSQACCLEIPILLRRQRASNSSFKRAARTLYTPELEPSQELVRTWAAELEFKL